jgi:uncharacterized protein (DUF1330 family)
LGHFAALDDHVPPTILGGFQEAPMADKEPENALTLVLIARIPPSGVEAFQAYEDQVLPLLNEHGGRLQRRLRNEPGTVELHIVSFPSEAALQNYRSDPRRAAATHLLERSSATQERFSLRDVE